VLYTLDSFFKPPSSLKLTNLITFGTGVFPGNGLDTRWCLSVHHVYANFIKHLAIEAHTSA